MALPNNPNQLDVVKAVQDLEKSLANIENIIFYNNTITKPTVINLSSYAYIGNTFAVNQIVGIIFSQNNNDSDKSFIHQNIQKVKVTAVDGNNVTVENINGDTSSKFLFNDYVEFYHSTSSDNTAYKQGMSRKGISDALTLLDNKIPTKTSELKNDSNFATETDITTALATAKAQWLLDMNPIGTIIENNTGTNPSTYIGGTWELYGQGRVTVCIDSNDLSFDKAGETGGSKALQRHTHTATFTGTKETGWFSGYQLGQGAGSADGKIFTSVNGTQRGCAKEYGTSPKFNFNLTPKGSITIEDAGTGDQANLQPYIVVYRWVRTA